MAIELVNVVNREIFGHTYLHFAKLVENVEEQKMKCGNL